MIPILISGKQSDFSMIPIQIVLILNVGSVHNFFSIFMNKI